MAQRYGRIIKLSGTEMAKAIGLPDGTRILTIRNGRLEGSYEVVVETPEPIDDCSVVIKRENWHHGR